MMAHTPFPYGDDARVLRSEEAKVTQPAGGRAILSLFSRRRRRGALDPKRLGMGEKGPLSLSSSSCVEEAATRKEAYFSLSPPPPRLGRNKR